MRCGPKSKSVWLKTHHQRNPWVCFTARMTVFYCSSCLVSLQSWFLDFNANWRVRQDVQTQQAGRQVRKPTVTLFNVQIIYFFSLRGPLQTSSKWSTDRCQSTDQGLGTAELKNNSVGFVVFFLSPCTPHIHTEWLLTRHHLEWTL